MVLAGAPKMPGAHYTDGTLMHLLLTYPVAAAGCLVLHVALSTALVRCAARGCCGKVECVLGGVRVFGIVCVCVFFFF